MTSTTQKLIEKGLARDAPPFLRANIHYETVVGSHAYGVADTSVKSSMPDYDVLGFAIPPKEMIFKHLSGWIPGFGDEPVGFEQWQGQKIWDPDSSARGKEWDIQILNIVKFFELCRENNPNLIDALFTPEHCVVHCTAIGREVRDNRRLFLSKLCWKKFRGYAYAQLKKLNDKQAVGGRKEIIDRFGFDVKFAYHIVRLFDEAEQILLESDIDLQRSAEVMKSIRRGEWKEEDLRAWVIAKDKALETAYVQCSLPEKPPLEPIKQLLVNCLEAHYGSLATCVVEVGWAEQTLRDIDALLSHRRGKLYTQT